MIQETQNIIIISSTLLYNYTKECISVCDPNVDDTITIQVKDNLFSMPNIAIDPVGCCSKNGDWEEDLTYTQLVNVNKFLRLLSEQPITLLFEGDGRVNVRCAII